MKKQSIRCICMISFLAASFVTGGCTFIQQSNELPEPVKATVEKIVKEEKALAAGTKKTEKQIPAASDKKPGKELQVINEYYLSRKLVSAFLKDDAKGFVALLPAKLRQEFDHKKFEVTRKAVVNAMGEPVSFRYVTALEMTAVTPHIWAVRFSRISRDEKEEYTSEMLFRVITGHLDGKPYIIGFNFF